MADHLCAWRSASQLGWLAAALLLTLPHAQAHHGWAWAESEPMTLQGQVLEVSMAPPHPSLTVQASDGTQWQVDLANPAQTERAGFRAASAKAGDAITVLGNRHQDRQRRHMKAVRITVHGQQYDLYPERIRN